MIIKVRNIKEAEKRLDKALKELYVLEDLNDYKVNSISKAVNLLQKIKLKRRQKW